MFKFFVIFMLMIAKVPLSAMDAHSREEQRKELTRALFEMTDQERDKALLFLELDWKRAGEYKLAESHSTISLPEGYELLIGEDAKKLIAFRDEPEEEYLEAIVYSDSNDMILFERSEKGYVTLEDWNEVKPKELLASITANTEDANEVRLKHDLEEIHVVGWIKEPTLDKSTNTVYWAIEAKCEGKYFINSFALKLGRESYERIIWVCSKESYMSSEQHLDVMLGAHRFDKGFRYEDYNATDNIARLGIAGLVSASLGVKILKTGKFLLFFKKFFGFLIAGLAAVFYKIKSFFGMKKAEEE